MIQFLAAVAAMLALSAFAFSMGWSLHGELCDDPEWHSGYAAHHDGGNHAQAE